MLRVVSINVRGTLGSSEAADTLLQEVTEQWPDLDVLFCAEFDFFGEDVRYVLGDGWSRFYAGEGSRAFGLWKSRRLRH